MRSRLPVYAIKDFRNFPEENAFYANDLATHIKLHDFTNSPHKHDFFLVVLFTAGSGTHEIDFEAYPVKPGTLFLLKPGQMHNWELSKNCEGYVFFHTRDFYEEAFTSERLHDYPFYASSQNSPCLLPEKKIYLSLKTLFREMLEEYESDQLMKSRKLHALLNLVYIEISRLYLPKSEPLKKTYLLKVQAFEDLIDKNFKVLKTAGEYAKLMHLSEKHLNRVCKTCLNKTSSDLISERIILEAKRMLIHSRLTVSQIGNALGYNENSYFSRFFKKHTGQTPLGFAEKYKH